MTDQQLLDLVLDECRAFMAHCMAALANDHSAAGHRTLGDWHAKQAALREAVMDQLEPETPYIVARVRKALRDDAAQYPRTVA